MNLPLEFPLVSSSLHTHFSKDNPLQNKPLGNTASSLTFGLFFGWCFRLTPSGEHIQTGETKGKEKKKKKSIESK